MQLNGFAVLFAILIADQVSPPAHRRIWPYVVAVTAGVLVGSALVSLLSQHVFHFATGYHAGSAAEQFHAFFFRHATHAFVVCGLATCVYVSQRWAAYRIAMLRAVQLDHAEAEKRLFESRLAAMQAQVEPRFLQQTLERVERLYGIDAEAADRVLKNLITYLRAAIPQIRNPVSTVAKEIELAQAYLNTLALGPGARLAQRHDGIRIGESARLPPMILLPLLNRALLRRTDGSGSSSSLEIDTVVSNDRLSLTIRDAGDGFADGAASDAELMPIRERLAALYGDRAQLALTSTAGGSAALIEIPYETLSHSIT
jgi:LytS/YehU family sensor histidine kinase